MIKSKRFSGVYQNAMKSGDISYYFTFKDIHDLDASGKPKSKRVKVGLKSNGITEAFVNQKRIEAVNAMKLGIESPIKHTKKKRFTLQNAFDLYIEWAKQNKKTWKRDSDLYTLHLNTLHGKEVTALTRKDFEALRDTKLKTLSPRTVEYILAVARQIINHAIDDELISNYKNPIRKIHGIGRGIMPKYDNAKLGYLSHDQAKEILEALKAHKESYWFSVLMLFTGARFEDVAILTWNSIDTDAGLITIQPSKNGNARKVLITPLIKEVLEELRPKKKSDQSPLIPNSLGSRWDRMPKQWQPIVDELYPLNITTDKKYRITPHTLRHTHASWLAKGGTDILRIKEQMGHKRLEMTLRYAHLIPDQRHDATQALFESFGGGK